MKLRVNSPWTNQNIRTNAELRTTCRCIVGEASWIWRQLRAKYKLGWKAGDGAEGFYVKRRFGVSKMFKVSLLPPSSTQGTINDDLFKMLVFPIFSALWRFGNGKRLQVSTGSVETLDPAVANKTLTSCWMASSFLTDPHILPTTNLCEVDSKGTIGLLRT